MRAIITVGCSATGKSTFAKHKEKEGFRIIERDILRREHLKMNVGYTHGELWLKWNFKNEGIITNKVNSIIALSALQKKDIIISDTNLHKERLNALTLKLQNLGYTVEMNYFIAPDVSTLIKRDRKRLESVGEEVLKTQWKRWLSFGEEITGIRQYTPNTNLPKAYIFDIDGTIASYGTHRGPYDWEKVGLDDPKREVINVLNALYISGYKIVFLSGRDACCYEDTYQWIKTHTVVVHPELHMRPTTSMEKDRIIKERLFFNEVSVKYNVLGVFDDRKQVVQLWNDMNVPCFNVGCSYEFF